jgi:hypothetical protein
MGDCAQDFVAQPLGPEEQDRRVNTKVVDVAPGSTGLLEVRVGRMSKDLSLTWSRLAKD